MSQSKDTEINTTLQKLYEHIVKGIHQGTIILPDNLKKSILELEALEGAERVKLINTLAGTEGLPKEICQYIELYMLKQAPLFEGVPEEVLKQVYEFTNLKTQSSLALTSTEHYKLFQPARLFSKFQQQVAFGGQDKVEELFALLKKQTRDNEIQELLCKEGTFTDYSGRTFKKCTAYEYAYWAKDTHMCRMLERHMDEPTKADMLKRCEAIEKDGLNYTQKGQNYCTKHFDLTPLKTALKDYVDGFGHWSVTNNRGAMKVAWMRVGLEQRDVPAHVIHEYCRPDRSFETPTFKEDTLPRSMRFNNYKKGQYELLFPLIITDISGLGVDFALIRALSWGTGVGDEQGCKQVDIDLLAIGRLDEVRTEDLKQSLENLKPKDHSLKPGCVIS